MEITGSLLLDNLLHLANVLYLFSYFVRDMLRLRLFTIVAASCLVVFFWTQPQPLWAAITWNLFFIVLNLIRTVRILRRRWYESKRRRGDAPPARRRLRGFVLPWTSAGVAGLRRAALVQSSRNLRVEDPFWFVSF